MTRALYGLVGTLDRTNREQGDGRGNRRLAEQLCRACVEGAGVDGAAISVLTTSVHRETLAATDPTAATLEDLQFALGEGACLEAASTGRPVLVPDLYAPHLTTRWPVFATTVAERTDVRALFAVPLQLGAFNVGVLDLYRTVPGPLGGPELRDVSGATDAAILLLLDAQRHATATDDPWEEHRENGPRYDRPWDDRAEVHRATGMVLAQLDVPAQDAFARLRGHAFVHGRPLGQIARDVVAGRLVFTDEME